MGYLCIAVNFFLSCIYSESRTDAAKDATLTPAPDADPLVKAVYGKVRDLFDRQAEAANARERFDDADRERSEQRHLNSLIAETLERQRHAGLASESASPLQRRENVRRSVLREHQSRVQSIFLSACQENRRYAPLIDHRADYAPTPPPIAEPAPPVEPVRVNGGDGSVLDTGGHQAPGQPRAEPAEQAAGRTQANQALPSTVPDQQAMPSTVSKPAGSSVDRGGERDDERNRYQSVPPQPATPSEGTTPRPGADRRAQGDGERDGFRPRPSRVRPPDVARSTPKPSHGRGR